MAEKSQSSQEDPEKEAEDDILGCMEIDDAEDMNVVADILLHLNVSYFAILHAWLSLSRQFWASFSGTCKSP